MSNRGTDAPVYLDGEEVAKLLNWKTLLPAIERILVTIAAENSSVISPTRTSVEIPQKRRRMQLLPSYLHDDDALTCKIIVVSDDQLASGSPYLESSVFYFDSTTGRLKMVMDGREFTGWKTAAVSVVATKHLYKKAHDKDLVVAILGSGVQAKSHAEAFLSNFDVKQVRVWNHNPEGAETLCKKIGDKAIPFIGVEECVGPADIIITTTRSLTPILRYDWLKPGVHINAIGFKKGFREIDSGIYERAFTAVAKEEIQLNELRNLLEAGLKPINIGLIIDGSIKLPPETSLTVFQSVGFGAADAVTAKLVHDAYFEQQREFCNR